MSRYSTTFVRDLWCDETTLELWGRVELAVSEAQGRSGLIPLKYWHKNAEHPLPTVEAWKRWEAETEHEMVGFLYAWDPPHPIHMGVTSSDIVDTANALRFKMWRDNFRVEISNLTGEAFQWAANQHHPMLARTHGQPALVERAADLWMHWVAMIERTAHHGMAANNEMLSCKISGPVGVNNYYVSEGVERLVADTLGLRIDHNPSQIVSRDIYGRWAFAMAQVCTAIEAFATQIRLFSLAGVNEYCEGRGGLTVGSSSMPQKANPILSERLAGVGRMARSMVEPLNDGMLQWHQRDLSQSSTERVMLPELMGLTHYAILVARDLIKKIEHREDNSEIATMWDASNEAYDDMNKAIRQGATYREARAKFQ